MSMGRTAGNDMENDRVKPDEKLAGVRISLNLVKPAPSWRSGG
jgi:hypothetical protein